MYAHSLCIKIANNFALPCINHNFCRFDCEYYAHEASKYSIQDGRKTVHVVFKYLFRTLKPNS